MRVPRFALRFLKNRLMPLASTTPDEIVGPGTRWRKIRPDGALPERPFLRRWFVIPKNKWCNIYLHCFLRDDEDRALHDHPWPNISCLLIGQFIEVTGVFDIYGRVMGYRRDLYVAGDLKFRHATDAHRIELSPIYPSRQSLAIGFAADNKDMRWLRVNDIGKICSWSLFVTGPVLRKWGFLCPSGWRSSTEFHDKKGCIND